MNELRMYVELLFEGKVLTADAIELKEEIYGNLVARYEDLLAEGVSEAEALRRTKESMTSIDDVLEEPVSMAGSAEQTLSVDGASGERDVAGTAAGAADAAAGAAAAHEGVAASAVTDAARAGASGAASAAPVGAVSCEDGTTAVVPDGAVLRDGGMTAPIADGARWHGDGDAAGTSDGATVRENGAASAATESPVAPSSHRARTGLSKTTKIVIAVLVGLLCLGGLGMWVFVELFGIDEAVESRVEAVEDRVEDKVTGAVEGVLGSVGNDASAELDQSILAVDPAVLAGYVGLSVADANQLTGLIAALPLGADYAQSVTGGAAGDTVSFELTNIPDALDDDAVERVLAFDAMALFTVLPEVSQVQIGVQEQGDSAAERDFYVFDRETMEVRCQAFPADHVGGFSPDLLDDATAWSALVKECTSASFYDEVCELAER